MAQLSDDCFAFGGSLLGIDAARAMIFERVTPVAGIERTPLRQALGRTLAHDIAAPIAVPGYDNSAVDGYAVRFDDLRADRPTTLRCIDRIAAGHDPSAPLTPGVATRIFTGAILPEGADVVIMQEDCELDGDRVTIRPGIKRGANRRKAGLVSARSRRTFSRLNESLFASAAAIAASRSFSVRTSKPRPAPSTSGTLW